MTQTPTPGAEAACTKTSVPTMHCAHLPGAHWASSGSLHTGFHGRTAQHDQVQDNGSYWVKTRERPSMTEKNAEKKHGASPTYQWKVCIHQSWDVGQGRPSAPVTGFTTAPGPLSARPSKPFPSRMLQTCCISSTKNAKNRKVARLAVKLKQNNKVQKEIPYSL